MSNRIERPTFSEGQILGALDLNATIEYDRGQAARHNRYLHIWGIAEGLKLTGVDKKTLLGQSYQEVTLSAGVAIDGKGREIVVPEPLLLREADFDEANVADAKDTAGEALYPVFLIGRDRAATQPAFGTGNCASAQPTRFEEDYEVQFGRPGDELDLDKQQVPAVSDGPDDPSNRNPWQVLLGFVQWDAGITKFKAVKESSAGIRPQYAGVLADEVAARAGQLTFRTRARSEGGKPAVLMDETDGGELKFGLLNSAGVLNPVFTVNAKGDITAAGKVSSPLRAGVVGVESGSISDGMLIPLPKGVTQQQVDDGQVVLHINVTPRYPGSLLAYPIPFECKVVGRRVSCLHLLLSLIGGTPLSIVPGTCDYTLLAFVKPQAEGNP